MKCHHYSSSYPGQNGIIFTIHSHFISNWTSTQPPLFYPHCHYPSSNLHPFFTYYNNVPTSYFIETILLKTRPISSKLYIATHATSPKCLIFESFFSFLSFFLFFTKLYPSFSSQVPHVHFRHSLIEPHHPTFHISIHVILSVSTVFFLHLSMFCGRQQFTQVLLVLLLLIAW